MYNYYYDGDFDGLLTVVFEAYKFRHELGEVSAQPRQMGFDLQEQFVETQYEKARRVERFIRKRISNAFFQDVQTCFLSYQDGKDTAIVHTIYQVMEKGVQILDSVEEYPFMMQQWVRQVLRERHRYLGLVRFREMSDQTLLAVIEPKNNVLPLLLSHFKNRLRRERFAIFDKKRRMLAYYDTKGFELFFTDKVEVQWSDSEVEFAKLWNVFHRSISIKERENKKRQQHNLPKYYWRHLVEDMSWERGVN